MGIETKVSHSQSKLGAMKPREYIDWTSLYVPYKIYICEYCISQLQNEYYLLLPGLRMLSTWAV